MSEFKFIDLRGSGHPKRFTFINTGNCLFVAPHGEESWNTASEFAEAFRNASSLPSGMGLKDFVFMMPPWALTDGEFGCPECGSDRAALFTNPHDKITLSCKDCGHDSLSGVVASNADLEAMIRIAEMWVARDPVTAIIDRARRLRDVDLFRTVAKLDDDAILEFFDADEGDQAVQF